MLLIRPAAVRMKAKTDGRGKKDANQVHENRKEDMLRRARGPRISRWYRGSNRQRELRAEHRTAGGLIKI